MTGKKRGPGRPVGTGKLTPKRQENIVQSLRAGNYRSTAVLNAGIHPDTFYDWLKRGAEEAGSKYSDFSDAVKKAEAEGEARDLKVIDDAAQKGSWQASAWKLERKYFTKWGRKEKQELTHKGEMSVNVKPDYSALSKEDREKALELEEKALAGAKNGAGGVHG